ncbi:hypothetical protein RhiXN_07698 [Rhizoctonia solani]|uniref:Uncharacterized protein n=1 Tax=Rhizoctonia solani TaxID=456999 RepID=A0A8H8SZI5_9AGAM|nr:uncharacterized protein RhiXN_07698 [Rhizoctonia solani]QRW22662.1 hypothetical protein RhiXN_07698 [Rhizoctonia solani]
MKSFTLVALLGFLSVVTAAAIPAQPNSDIAKRLCGHAGAPLCKIGTVVPADDNVTPDA